MSLQQEEPESGVLAFCYSGGERMEEREDKKTQVGVGGAGCGSF